MAGNRRVQRKKQKKRQSRKKKVQKGSGNPFYVDFKKGVNVTKRMTQDLKQPIYMKKPKATVAG